MATYNDDWFDLNAPQGLNQEPQDDTGPTNGGGTPSGQTDPAKRKNDIIEGIIKPGYRDILGRDPTSVEIEEAYAMYEAQGGDAFRKYLESRKNNNPNGNKSASDFPHPNLPDIPGAPEPPKPWTDEFHAPTPEEAAQTPGFQFQLGEGLKALQRSAAARGTLLTGGTVKGLQGFATDLANRNYGDVYNRAYNEYEGRRTNFLTNEMNRYNAERGNRLDTWGINSDYFNMGRANRLDDYNIWSGIDMNTFMKLLQLARLKKPTLPTGY